MNATRFGKPVPFLLGEGCPASIASAEEAFRVLCENRASAATHAHSVALEACKAAIAGEIDAEIARSAFAAFAETHAMLLPVHLSSRPVAITHPEVRALSSSA